MGKISGPCKAAAKKKFEVWPSAYASGWGVRCTKAGGPSKMGLKIFLLIVTIGYTISKWIDLKKQSHGKN